MPGPGSTADIVCPADAIAIAPGFRSGGGLARVVGRYPGVPNLGRLGTDLSVLAPETVTSSVRCLARETTRAGGHRDRLRLILRGSDTAVRAGRVERPSVECSPRESGVVGAFRLTGAWYLGQNARGRNRTFKLQAATPLVTGHARLAALCLSLRTVPA